MPLFQPGLTAPITPYKPIISKYPIFILVMKYILLKALIQESNAQQKLEALPKGNLFNDAKSIKGVFDSSDYTWSQAIEAFEKHKHQAKIISIPIDSIKITQPNIQLHKTLDIIPNLSKTPTINAVKFDIDNTVIFDGHHRLIANWALGNSSVKVNLVDLTKL